MTNAKANLPHTGHPPQDFFGRVTTYFIQSRVTLLLILTLVIFGVMAVLFTPKEENPQIVVPAADVYVNYPGAPAEVVEKMVTTRVEAKIRELTGVEHIYSASQNSGAKITVQFFVGQPWENSLFKLQNQLFNHQDYLLPPGASYVVKPINIDDVPIVTLTLTGKHYTDNELRRVGERLLEDLRRIPNTGNCIIVGGQERTIRVDLDPDKLASYRLSLAMIAQRLQGENTQRNAGDVIVGENRLFLQGGELFQSAADVGQVIVGYQPTAGKPDDRLIPPIYLRDVATIRDDFGDHTTLSRIHYRRDRDITQPYPNPTDRPTGEFVNQSAITIGIAKKHGTNAVTVARQIFDRLAALKPQLPPGIQIAITRNDGRTASKAVNDLYRSLMEEIVIVVGILVFFLGWRNAGIVSLVIPITLGGTLAIGWIAGQTINRITLFALILSLAVLVDDAIAVVENIHRYFEMKPGMTYAEKVRAVIAAIAEMGREVVVANLLVILAFLPMGFVTGMMGPYMGPIPFNVPVAVIISTVFALTITPFLALRLMKQKFHRHIQTSATQNTQTLHHALNSNGNGPVNHNGKGNGNYRSIHPLNSETLATELSSISATLRQNRTYRWYRFIMEPLLDSAPRRRLVLLVITGVFLATLILPLTQAVKFRMLPKADKDTFLVQLDAPNGTTLAETDRIVRQLEAALQQEPEITNFETYVGTRAPIDFNSLLRGGTATPAPFQVPMTVYSLGYTPTPLPTVTTPLPSCEHLAEIRVHLTDQAARNLMSEVIVFRLRPQLADIATQHNAVVKLVEEPPGPPVRSTLLAEIYGPDYNTLRSLAKQVRQVFQQTAEVVDVDDSVRNPVPQMKLVVDRDQVLQAGLSTHQVSQELTAAIAGINASILQVPGELMPVPIRLRFALANRQSLADLTRIKLPTPTGDLLPLTELVKFEPTTVDQPIFHKDQLPVTYVIGEMGNRSSVYAVLDQIVYFGRHPLPPGYWIQWDGEWKLTLDVFRDLGLAMLVAILLIYIILVWQFSSFKIPLIILGSIPLAMIGILCGFSLNGVYFSATAMIGVVAMAGIVVRNAIVLLEFIGDRRREGEALKAAILQAGAVRFRPILLTSVTTMLGTFSILSDPVWSGLAWTILCGMLSSSALTLFVIPLMYYGYQQKPSGRFSSREVSPTHSRINSRQKHMSKQRL